MRNHGKTLELNKETLRRLDAGKLDAVAGGRRPTQTFETGASYCFTCHTIISCNQVSCDPACSNATCVLCPV